MKHLLYLVFQLSLTPVFAQNVRVTRLDDPCVMIKYIHSTTLSRDRLHIKKDSIPNLMTTLRSCNSQFHYSYSFSDHPFELIIPGYLTKVGYGYSDEKFEIYFYDSNDTVAKIIFSYDFAGEYKRWFREHIHAPGKKVTEKNINGTKVWTFPNQDSEFVGVIFLSDNLYISYYTPFTSRIPDLEKALISFKWE